jgi:hypothetical protein
VDQVKVMEAEQAAVDQELEGCKSMCTALDTELSEKRKVRKSLIDAVLYRVHRTTTPNAQTATFVGNAATWLPR